MKEQSKYMKAAWIYSHGALGVRIKFAGINNHQVDGAELNTLAASAVARALKINNRSKSKAKYDSDL